MDYEKKYNEALERARALRREAIEKDYVEDYVKDYETIFPELRESKSLRPVGKEFLQPHWKPSNTQINYLGAAVIEAQRRHNESVNGFPRYYALKELYEQLLKL